MYIGLVCFALFKSTNVIEIALIDESSRKLSFEDLCDSISVNRVMVLHS